MRGDGFRQGRAGAHLELRVQADSEVGGGPDQGAEADQEGKRAGAEGPAQQGNKVRVLRPNQEYLSRAGAIHAQGFPQGEIQQIAQEGGRPRARTK